MNTLEITIPAKDKRAAITPTVDPLALDTAKPLEEVFQPYQTTLEKWESKVQSLVVTDISQTTEMEQARLARLELKKARVAMDNTRKGLVEGLKARTSKIDSTARVIREKMEALEETLKESEEFAERHAAKVKAELKQKREAELAPFLDGPIITDLSALSEEDYTKALSDAKLLRQAKIDAAAKAESERKAKELADRIERERIANENARLKAEAEEREAAAKAERDRIEAERAEERRKAKEEAERVAAAADVERKRLEAEAKKAAEQARKEREAIEEKARLEAEKAAKEAAKLKAELEAKAREEQARIAKEKAAEAAEKARIEVERAAAEEARRQAAAAPDAAKLKAFAAAVRGLELPELSNATIGKQLAEQNEKFAKWAEAQIPKLTLV